MPYRFFLSFVILYSSAIQAQECFTPAKIPEFISEIRPEYPEITEEKASEGFGLIFENGIPVAYEESLYDGWCQRFKITRLVHMEQTPFQRLLIFDNPIHGRVLVLDDSVQITQKDHRIYSEAMAHVPIIAHGNVKKVLIVGGGDGSILWEVLRHQGVEKAVLVDIDKRVIETVKEYMPDICRDAFDNPRAEILVQDAAEYAETTKEKFDIIIVDSSDPVGCNEPLFGREFYQNCKNLLNPCGILVNQNGVPHLQPQEIETILVKQQCFGHAGFYQFPIPTYVGGTMIIGWASDDTSLLTVSPEELQKRRAAIEGEMQYYTPQVHQAAFALPAFIEKQIINLTVQ